MGSDPEDHDDEAALRARLDRLSAELKGRAAPPSAPKPKSRAQTGRRRRVGDVAWLAGRQRVRLRGHRRLRDWLGSRPRARHQSCLPDCIFPARRRGRGVERDPADFAKRRRHRIAIRPCLARTRRIKTCGARFPGPDGTPRWGGAEPLAGGFSLATRRTTTRTRGRGDRVGTGDRSDPSICHASRRLDSGRGPRRFADQFRPLHAARGGVDLPSGGDRRARRRRACRDACRPWPKWPTSSSPAWCAPPPAKGGCGFFRSCSPSSFSFCSATLIGFIPYSFTVTSQIIITAALALMVFFTVVVVGIKDHGLHFFKLFVPPDVPIYILPLVVAIEVVSFFVAPGQPFGALVRQHARWPYHAQRLRRVRRHAARSERGCQGACGSALRR